MLSGEETNTNFIGFGLTDQGSNPRSTTLQASTLTITPLMKVHVHWIIYLHYYYILKTIPILSYGNSWSISHVEFYTNKMRITNNVEIKSITINKYCINTVLQIHQNTYRYQIFNNIHVWQRIDLHCFAGVRINFTERKSIP